MVYVLRLDAGHEIAVEGTGWFVGEVVGPVVGVVALVAVVPGCGGGAAPPPTSLQFVVDVPSGAVS